MTLDALAEGLRMEREARCAAGDHDWHLLGFICGFGWARSGRQCRYCRAVAIDETEPLRQGLMRFGREGLAR